MKADTRLSKTFTRDEIAAIMQDEGYDVAQRTIRYWEANGNIPRPIKVGRYVVHSSDVLRQVRVLAATRPAAIRQLRKNIAARRGKIVKVETSGDTLIVTMSHKKSNESEE